jgi:hypothetical protein
MARHWLNYAESNRAAAELILQKAAAGDESVAPLIAWAKRILEKAEPAKHSPANSGESVPPEQLGLEEENS